MNPWCMACCHEAEASPVYPTCLAFSPNSFHKNPQYSYAELLIHRLALKKKIPSEEMYCCSRQQTTCSWSLTSSASNTLDGRRMSLPLRSLLVCSWVITINPAFIYSSDLEWKSLSFWPVLVGPCTKQVALFLVIFQQMGTNFAAIYLKYLGHMSSYS